MNDSLPSIGQLIEPGPVKFSFAAPAWYVLEGLLLLICLMAIYFIWKHYHKNIYRSQALKQLEQNEQLLLANKQYNKMIFDANMIMKRIAMQHYDRDKVASLRDTEWTTFLNKTSKSEFNNNDVQILNSIYTKEEITEDTMTTFINKTKHWIRRHDSKYKL